VRRSKVSLWVRSNPKNTVLSRFLKVPLKEIQAANLLRVNKFVTNARMASALSRRTQTQVSRNPRMPVLGPVIGQGGVPGQGPMG
jgi:hypothetical protein